MRVSAALNIIIPITFITSFLWPFGHIILRHFFLAFFYDFLIKSNIMLITTMIIYICSFWFYFLLSVLVDKWLLLAAVTELPPSIHFI